MLPTATIAKKGDRRDLHGAEAGKQDDEDAQEAVAARDRRDELVVEARGLDRTGEAGERAADGERRQHVAVGGTPSSEGALGVAADRLELEAERVPRKQATATTASERRR